MSRSVYDPQLSPGCIVTVRLPSGRRLVAHRYGLAIDALREIVDSLPDEGRGCEVESISTPRTIMRDLQWPHRQRAPRPRRSPTSDYFSTPAIGVDPWGVERSLLAKLGRPDLLPPRMLRPPHNVRVHPLRRRHRV